MPADRADDRAARRVVHRAVYTPEEIRYCQNRKQATQHFAGRWAAKEAVLKALGCGWRRGISWRDIEIRGTPSGRPVAAVRGVLRELVEQLGVRRIVVSISHCRSYAVVYAIALGRKRKGDVGEGDG